MGLTQRKNYLRGIAECELVLNRGVPVLQSFAKALLRHAGAKPDFDPTGGEYQRYLRELRAFANPHSDSPVTSEARLTFAEAFDLDVDQQLAMEDALDSWEFSLDGARVDPGGMDPVTWTSTHTEFH